MTSGRRSQRPCARCQKALPAGSSVRRLYCGDTCRAAAARRRRSGRTVSQNVTETRSARFLRSIRESFEAAALEQPLLDEAARVLDRIDELAAELRASGLVDRGSKGQPRVSPLVAELRHQQTVLTRMLSALIVPDEPDHLDDL